MTVFLRVCLVIYDHVNNKTNLWTRQPREECEGVCGWRETPTQTFVKSETSVLRPARSSTVSDSVYKFLISKRTKVMNLLSL